MSDKLFYPAFSQRRKDLRKEWEKSTIKDWIEFLELAEYRSIRVEDALNKSIDSFTHSKIKEIYFDLYKLNAV